MHSNEATMRAYLAAVEAIGPQETMADFCAPEMTFQEFPNRVAPLGCVRRGDQLRAAWEQGRKFMKSQAYRVQRVIESGDDMAVELEWTGILAIPVMNLPAGSEMKAGGHAYSSLPSTKINCNRKKKKRCHPERHAICLLTAARRHEATLFEQGRATEAFMASPTRCW